MAAPVQERRGRRPAGSDTRGSILAAAREQFAAKGYDGASVRAIARGAGVDPALVHHYFGSKEQTFVAAMELPILPAEMVPRLLAGDPAGLGERVAGFFFATWDDAESRRPFVALLASSASSEQAASMLRSFVSRAIFDRIVSALPPRDDAALRVTLAGSQLVGAAWLRYVVHVEPLASVAREDVVRLVAPVIQSYLVPEGP